MTVLIVVGNFLPFNRVRTLRYAYFGPAVHIFINVSETFVCFRTSADIVVA